LGLVEAADWHTRAILALLTDYLAQQTKILESRSAHISESAIG
jgi:hypothetical protein